tara:strand:+ start:298 stop:576 length:279 start_codon:yes stop_codon:yes gene_type:complete
MRINSAIGKIKLKKEIKKLIKEEIKKSKESQIRLKSHGVASPSYIANLLREEVKDYLLQIEEEELTLEEFSMIQDAVNAALTGIKYELVSLD